MRSFSAGRLALAALVAIGLPASVWAGIHRTTWLGPLLADTARAVAGPEAVAWAEDRAYNAQDAWKRTWSSNDEPCAYWPVASGSPRPPTPTAVSTASTVEPTAPFPPERLAPMHAKRAAEGDGTWTPIVHLSHPNDPPRMFKTLLHPDPKRPWTSVAIVAIDLRTTTLHLEPGVYVPEPTEPGARGLPRPGLVPEAHRAGLLAAFNGGFKTIHGRFGMRVSDVTIVRPQPHACTVARDRDGAVRVASWSKLPLEPDALLWYRQTPPCLVEAGVFGEGLSDQNMNWGVGVGGATFIRRSAVGVDASGTVLFVGLGESIAAPGMARAMRHAGATTVAALDVNWSLPKFVVYQPRSVNDDALVAHPLYDELRCTDDEYVREPSSRDFFYITVAGST